MEGRRMVRGGGGGRNEAICTSTLAFLPIEWMKEKKNGINKLFFNPNPEKGSG